MRTKKLAHRPRLTPEQVEEAIRRAEEENRQDNSVLEEPEDLSRALIQYTPPSQQEVPPASTTGIPHVEESLFKDVPKRTTEAEILLRWVRSTFPEAYTTQTNQEGTSEFASQDTIPHVEISSDSSSEEADKAAAETLKEVLDDISRQANSEQDPVTSPVATHVATPGNSDDSDNVPIGDRFPNLPQKRKGTEMKDSQEKKKKKISFADPEIQITSKPKRPGKSSKTDRKAEKATKSCRKSVAKEEDRFLNKAAKGLFASLTEKGVIAERKIDEEAFARYGLVTLLKERGLLKSATFAESFNLQLVQEFYCNLSSSSTQDFSKVYVRGKWIPFSPAGLNKFLDCRPTEDSTLEDISDVNAHVVKTITAGKTESWGNDNRMPASFLSAKYNILFRLCIHNWLPTAHNSSISKEMAVFLFSVGTGRKIDLGKLIYQNIVEDAENISVMTSLAYPVLLSQYLLQHGVALLKGETLSPVKKLKISPKLFTPGKKVDLPVGRDSSTPPPDETELTTEEAYEKMLKEQLEDLERRQRAMAAELFTLARQKQTVLARLEALKKKTGATEVESRR